MRVYTEKDGGHLDLRVGWSTDRSNLMLGESKLFFCHLSTADENIIATIKIGNNFCYPLKMFQYCDNNIGLFSIAPLLVIALNLFASILYEFCRLVYSFYSALLPI